MHFAYPTQFQLPYQQFQIASPQSKLIIQPQQIQNQNYNQILHNSMPIVYQPSIKSIKKKDNKSKLLQSQPAQLKFQELEKQLTQEKEKTKLLQAQLETSHSSIPLKQQHYFSIMTWNLWKQTGQPTKLEERTGYFKQFFQTVRSDILCTQELHPEYHKIITQCFPEYDFIDSDFQGWKQESNIYFNRNKFQLLDFGCEPVKHSKIEPLRRLFWCNLIHIQSKQKLKICTVHVTWQGSPEDKETEFDMRKIVVNSIIEVLKDDKSEIIICGDMNDQIIVPKLFRSAGFTSCFEDLQIKGSSTHPSPHICPHEDTYENETLDWIFKRAKKLKTIIANVMKYRFASISDHFPVLAMYEICDQ